MKLHHPAEWRVYAVMLLIGGLAVLPLLFPLLM